MPRGGYRPGSGRPPGAISTRSREIAERALANGKTPLEVMLENMRFYDEQAAEMLADLVAGSLGRRMPDHTRPRTTTNSRSRARMTPPARTKRRRRPTTMTTMRWPR